MMPSGWSKIKLKDYTAKIGSGKTPSGGEKTYSNSGILFIRSQNVYPNQLRLNGRTYISEEIDASMKGSRVLENDVLLNITGASIGRCCVYRDSSPANVNQHVCIIRPADKINPNYLSYFLNSQYGQKQIESFLTKGNREGLNFQQIGSFEIPVPPQKSEQEKIAKILSTWDEAIEKLYSVEKALKDRHIYLQKKCFSNYGVITDLKNVVEIMYGKSPKGFIVENGKFPVVGTGGVVGRTNNPITSDDSVVLGRKGTLDNPIYVVGPCLPIDTTFWIKPKIGYQLRWLFHLTKYLDLFKYNEASGVPSLSRENLYKVKIPNHTAATQKKIIQMLDCSCTEVGKMVAVRRAVQAQKQGLMQQLLTGKKRVKV